MRTRNFSFGVHELEPPATEFRIDLVAPSGEVWSYGPEDAAQTLTGSAYDFCLLVTQRAHRDDLDLVANADHVVDLGPGGGDEGGRIVAVGTPEEVAEDPASLTGRYLRRHLGI